MEIITLFFSLLINNAVSFRGIIKYRVYKKGQIPADAFDMYATFEIISIQTLSFL